MMNRINGMKRFAILILLLLSPSIAQAASHYVNCNAVNSNGDGTALQISGVHYAYQALPIALVRGDTYYVAGDATCAYPFPLFNVPDSGTSLITVLKVTSAQSGVAGYTAGMATNQAVITMPAAEDPQQNHANALAFCNSYFTFDGVTGSTNPATVGGQGFLLKTPNLLTHGFITGGGNSGCIHGPADAPLSHITVAHVEVYGYGDERATQPLSACSYAGTTATVTFANATVPWPIPLIVGDKVDLFTDTSLTAKTVAAGQVIAGIGSDGMGHTTYDLAVATNPCAAAKAVNSIFIGNPAFYLADFVDNTVFQNWTISDNYTHDVALCGTTAHLDSIVITRNYCARNMYTNAEHSNGWVDHPAIGVASTNVTYSYNYFVDISGTAVIAIFNGLPTGSGVVTDSGWAIYGNVFAHLNPSVHAASRLFTCYSTSTYGVACSHFKFFNNTIYNMSNPAGSARIDMGSGADSSSVDVEVYDNVWIHDFNVLPAAGTGSVCLDEKAACASTAEVISDYNYYSQLTGQSAPAEVHGQHAKTHCPTSSCPFVNASAGNFHLATREGLNAGLSLELASICQTNRGFCVDAEGITRGTGGKWDRGAYQFSGDASKPPTNLRTTSVP